MLAHFRQYPCEASSGSLSRYLRPRLWANARAGGRSSLQTALCQSAHFMIIRRLYTAYALLNFLEQADPVAQQVGAFQRSMDVFPRGVPGTAALPITCQRGCRR